MPSPALEISHGRLAVERSHITSSKTTPDPFTQPPLRPQRLIQPPGCPLRADRCAPVYLVLKAGFALHSRAAYLHYVPVRSTRFCVQNPKESVRVFFAEPRRLPAGTPAGVRNLLILFRWYRCARPPATGFDASGISVDLPLGQHWSICWMVDEADRSVRAPA